MSFSSEVKDDLLAVSVDESTGKAMSYGMLLYGRNFSKTGISLLTEHRGTAEKYASVIFSLCGVEPEIVITDGGKYKIAVTDRAVITDIFSGLDIIGGTMTRRVNSGMLESNESRAAFLRGVFLVCGTVTDPEKEYHFEFASPTGSLAKDLVAVFADMGEDIPINPKITDRNGAHIVYMKKSEDIEDTLALIGAQNKSLDIMGVKVMKDVRNTVNRRMNFENANMARTAEAAAKQCHAIEKLKKAGIFDTLGEDIKEMAELRLEEPELSGSELALKLSKPLSVSGINHRFAKLIKMAEDIK